MFWDASRGIQKNQQLQENVAHREHNLATSNKNTNRPEKEDSNNHYFF